jgi:hypothetical protein
VFNSGSTPQRMDFSDLLDAAGKLYTQNAALFIPIYAIPVAADLILSLLGTGTGFIGSIIVGVGLAALINAIAARSQNRPMTISDAYSSLPLSTYIFFVIGWLLFWIAVALGLILVVVPGLYLFTRWVFFGPIVVVDRIDCFEAFRRSWHLSQGNLLRIFGYGLILLIMFAIAEGLAVGFGAAGGILGVIIELFAYPFIFAVLVELYFNLRVLHGDPVVTGTHADNWG